MTEENLPPAQGDNAAPPPPPPPAPPVPPPPPPAPPAAAAPQAGPLYGRNTLIAIGAVALLYAGITAWQLLTAAPKPAAQPAPAPAPEVVVSTETPVAAPAEVPGEVETSTSAAATAPLDEGEKAQAAAALDGYLTPSEALRDVVGEGKMSRDEITRKLYAYIKKNGLQDKNSRFINCDRKLEKLFPGRKQFSMFDLAKMIEENTSE